MSPRSALNNVMKIFRSSTQEVVDAGMVWYDEAHEIARDMACRHGLPTIEHAAGIISVLSPAVRWETNVIDAESVCKASRASDIKVSTYGAFKRKAIAIKLGSDPSTLINPVTAPKTYSFWRCICEPSNKEFVVVDRHALAVAMGREVPDDKRSALLRGKDRYKFYADVYIRAAKKEGILPHQMQAITWLTWRTMQ